MCNSVSFAFISFFAVLLTINAQSRCQNEPNGTQLPMPNSRITYLICLNGIENIRNCQSGREFDPFDRRCLPALTSNTGTRSIPASRTPNHDLCFNHKDGTYLADQHSRNRFILCENGVGLSGECPTNQVFNQNTSLCEIQPRPAPIRVSSPTRAPINMIRSTTLRSSFSNANMRPTPRVVQQNIPHRSPSLQRSEIVAF